MTSAADSAGKRRGDSGLRVVEQGRAWIAVKSIYGKAARYVPKWIGGNPAQGGGPEAKTVEAISRLQNGDRISVKWYIDDHLRIESIESKR